MKCPASKFVIFWNMKKTHLVFFFSSYFSFHLRNALLDPKKYHSILQRENIAAQKKRNLYGFSYSKNHGLLHQTRASNINLIYLKSGMLYYMAMGIERQGIILVLLTKEKNANTITPPSCICIIHRNKKVHFCYHNVNEYL